MVHGEPLYACTSKFKQSGYEHVAQLFERHIHKSNLQIQHYWMFGIIKMFNNRTHYQGPPPCCQRNRQLNYPHWHPQPWNSVDQSSV